LFKLENVQEKLRIKTFGMIAREIDFFAEKNDVVVSVKFFFIVDFDFSDLELLVLFDESFSVLNSVDDIALQELDNASNCF
jgi:hypothetical protein